MRKNRKTSESYLKYRNISVITPRKVNTFFITVIMEIPLIVKQYNIKTTLHLLEFDLDPNYKNLFYFQNLALEVLDSVAHDMDGSYACQNISKRDLAYVQQTTSAFLLCGFSTMVATTLHSYFFIYYETYSLILFVLYCSIPFKSIHQSLK